jgi:hypothetical protein
MSGKKETIKEILESKDITDVKTDINLLHPQGIEVCHTAKIDGDEYYHKTLVTKKQMDFWRSKNDH